MIYDAVPGVPKRADTSLPQPASYRLRLLHIGAFCAFLAAVCVAVQTVILATVPSLDLTVHHGPGQFLLYTLVVVCILLFLGVSRREAAARGQAAAPSPLSRPFSAYARQKRRVWRGFLAGLLPTLGCTLIGYALLLHYGSLQWRVDPRYPLSVGLAVRTIFALSIVVVLTTTEEMIFRAFLFNYLYTQRRPRVVSAAVIASSLLFAAVHHFNNPLVWLQPRSWPLFLTLFLLGSLLCYIYMTGGSLACAVGLHTGLLLPEVFRNQSHLMILHQNHWWLGTSKDIRTAPITWALLIVLAALVRLNRRKLNDTARIDVLE